jgi:hypothetical protein
MRDLLESVLGSFWRFVGTVVLIMAIGEATAAVVAAFRKRP